MNKALRELILERDGHRCRECGHEQYGFYDSLHVHHVTPRKYGGGDDPDNLLTLCRPCHAKADKLNGALMDRAPRKTRAEQLAIYCKKCETSLIHESFPINPRCLECRLLRRILNGTRPNPEKDLIYPDPRVRELLKEGAA